MNAVTFIVKYRGHLKCISNIRLRFDCLKLTLPVQVVQSKAHQNIGYSNSYLAVVLNDIRRILRFRTHTSNSCAYIVSGSKRFFVRLCACL